MNTCTFAGRIVADAEMKTAQSGTDLCRVRVASDTGWGERKKVHFLSCVLFGQRGVSLQPHLTKGSHVTVVGDLEPPELYEANGETRVSQSLVIREIALQGGGQAGNQGGNAPQGAQNAPQGGSGGGGAATPQGQVPSGSGGGSGGAAGGFDDDVPFIPVPSYP